MRDWLVLYLEAILAAYMFFHCITLIWVFVILPASILGKKDKKDG